MTTAEEQTKNIVEVIMPDGRSEFVDADNLTDEDIARIEGGREKRNDYLVKGGRLHPPYVNKVWYGDEWVDVDHCIMRPHGAGLPLDYYEDLGAVRDEEEECSDYDFENDRYYTNEELGLEYDEEDDDWPYDGDGTDDDEDDDCEDEDEDDYESDEYFDENLKDDDFDGYDDDEEEDFDDDNFDDIDVNDLCLK